MKKPTFTLLAAFLAATTFSGNLSESLGPSVSRAVPVHFAFNFPTGETVGKTFSTNLNGTAILSRDVIRISGTATPTCHVVGVGRK